MADIAYITGGEHYQGTAQTTNTATIDFSGGGTNTILVAFFLDVEGAAATGMTWNGNALTSAGASVNVSGAEPGELYCFYQKNPNAVNGNLVGNLSTSHRSEIIGMFYSNASQGTQPQGYQTGAVDTDDPSISITTAVDNCWVVGGALIANGGTISDGTNWHKRIQVTARETFSGDSNGSVGAAGAKTIQFVTSVDPSNCAEIAFAIAPVPTVVQDIISTGYIPFAR